MKNKFLPPAWLYLDGAVHRIDEANKVATMKEIEVIKKKDINEDSWYFPKLDSRKI